MASATPLEDRSCVLMATSNYRTTCTLYNTSTWRPSSSTRSRTPKPWTTASPCLLRPRASTCGRRHVLGHHGWRRDLLVRHRRRSWRKEGDWALPFVGKAEHVPEARRRRRAVVSGADYSLWRGRGKLIWVSKGVRSFRDYEFFRDRPVVVNYNSDSDDVAPFFSLPDPDTQAMDDDGTPLPPASARFDRPPDARGCSVDFHLLRGGYYDDVMVVSTDPGRRTVIYDVGRRAVRGGPMMRATKGSPVSVAVGDGLYVIERVVDYGSRRFEALRYDRLREDWYWYGLPLPPYVREPGYSRSSVMALTPAAGGRIWMTTKGVGTYSFDTRRRSWRKEGDWALPFIGEAQHVPGHGDGLSFGFLAVESPFGYTSRNGPLCAVDLATATDESPPVVRGVWEEFKPVEKPVEKPVMFLPDSSIHSVMPVEKHASQHHSQLQLLLRK